MRAYRPSADAPEAALNGSRRETPTVPEEDAKEALGLLLVKAESYLKEALGCLKALQGRPYRRPKAPSMGATRFQG